MSEVNDKNKPDARKASDFDLPTNPNFGTAEPSQPSGDSHLSERALRDIAQRFDLLNELGRGGMGIVYRARDRETSEIVALKILKPEIANSPNLIERFKTELRLARKITHKNVCRSYDLHRFGETVVIAMEYVEGESLRAVLSRPGGVSLRGGMNWASQICAALTEAHAQGIIHRDLKPENIVIDLAGQAKVMDFGIARSMDTTAITGVITGTPAYMSPEQAEGKAADARSDIYSLGLILYEMFTGRQGLTAESPIALAHKQIHETPPPPQEVEPDLPRRIDRAIQRCLEKKPEGRFQSVTEVEAALNERPGAKPDATAGGEVDLPLHLSHWQRSDWLLVLAAIVGLAVFFPFFNRTSLAPRCKVQFDRSELRHVAQGFAQKLGAPLDGDASIDSAVNGFEYDYLARTAGARVALELTNHPLLYSSWQVTWDNGTQVVVTNSGALQGFTRDFPGEAPQENLSIEDARALAEKALREFFDRDPSLLRLEYKAADQVFSGHSASVLRWVEPGDYYGIKRHYEVRLVGRSIGAMTASDEVPGGYNWPYFYRQLLPLFAFVLPGIVLGLIRSRQVDSTAPWRIIFLGVAVVLFEWHFWPQLGDEPAVNLIVSIVTIAITSLFVFFCGSAAIEHLVRKTAPAKFQSLIQGFRGKGAASPACGLGFLRGTCLGFALLGLDSLLVWAGTAHLGMRLDSFFQMGYGRLSERLWPAAGVALYGFSQAIVVAAAIPLLSSLAAGFLRRYWLVLIPAALVAAILPGPLFSMGGVQPYHWKLVLLFIECLVLTLCYARFDVLTLFWTAFTFVFCLQNYWLLVIFEPAGNSEQWIGFAVFGLFVAIAGAFAFRSPLRAARKRLAAAFE